MSKQYLPTNREILKFNRKLPEDLRQCSVVLQFKKHMPKPLTEHFYCIRLTQAMLGSGEEDFWKPEVTQPRAVGKQMCLGCGRLMKRIAVLSTTCVNPACSMAGRACINGPRRGVHSIKTEFKARTADSGDLVNVSFVVGQEWHKVDHDVWLYMGKQRLKRRGFSCLDADLPEVIQTTLHWPDDRVPVEMVCGCLLVLDRRYSESCLCAVWRTAGHLCDKMGWALK